MQNIGEDAGLRPGPVGEQHAAQTSYGTPMALMLLPFWTDGCIGSMEGLFFEASAPRRTTSSPARRSRPHRLDPVRNLRYDDR